MSHASHLEAVLSWCDKFENLDEDGVRPASQNVFGAELPPSIDETPGDIKEGAEVIKGTASDEISMICLYLLLSIGFLLPYKNF